MLDMPYRDPETRPEPRLRSWTSKVRSSRAWAIGKAWAARAWQWRTLIAVAALSALLIRSVIWPAVFGPVVNVEAVTRAEFVQSVVASGHVEAPFRVSVGSQVTGVVTDVPVDEGQTVKTGDTLVVLDDREAKAAVVQAEGAVAQAEARMRQMREFTLPTAEENLRQARATLDNAEQAYQRTSKLAETNISTKAALDDAIRARNVARAQVRSAELQVLTTQPNGSDYVMAQTLLNQAHASLATAKSRLSYTVIQAPRDGILISRNVERGNVVQPSMVLMLLSPFADTQIVVQIDEKNLGLISIDQHAVASADAFPNSPFHVVVSYINPGVDLQRASVQVKLRVPDPPVFLRQDMTVSVDIETARHPDAVVVPLTSLRGLSTGSPSVLKVAAGRARKQAVRIGLTGSGKAEVLDGLAVGDQVIPATASVRDGQAMRPQLASAKAASEKSP